MMFVVVLQRHETLSFILENQGQPTRWNSDSPNKPNTVSNSESIVMGWLTNGDNWSIYKGGK